MTSKFVQTRDAVESFLSSLFHKSVSILAPVVTAAAQAAGPLLEQAAITVGTAVATAASNGTAHGSHEMIDVGLKSLREQTPTLEASVATAVVASVVQSAKEAAAQATTAVPPPA